MYNMSNNEETLTNYPTPYVSAGKMNISDLGNVLYDQRAYTFYEKSTNSVACLYTKVVTETPDENDSHESVYCVTIHSLDHVSETQVPFAEGKYEWSQVGTALEISTDDICVNRIALKTIDDNNCLLFLINTDHLDTVDSQSIRVYAYNKTNDTHNLLSISDADFGNDRIVSHCDPGKYYVGFKDNVATVYELTNFASSGFDISVSASINDLVPAGKSLIPNYSFMNGKKTIFGFGVPVGNRYALTDIVIYDHITNDDNTKSLVHNSSIDLSAKEYTAVRKSSSSVVINKNGDRLSFIHTLKFYFTQIDRTLPRYYASIYKHDVNLGWCEFRGMGGSILDPNYVEVIDTVTDEQMNNYPFTPEQSGQYRNIYASPDDEGEYLNMWVPYIQYENDIVAIRPEYEPIMSIARIDSIRDIKGELASAQAAVAAAAAAEASA